MFNAISYDIETLGTEPGDVILSIGAVELNTGTGETGDEFHCTFDRLQQPFMRVLESTENWWRHPDQAAARPFLEIDRAPTLHYGLTSFAAWLKGRNVRGGFWSRGYFDENLLGAAYLVCGLEKPWPYACPTDIRTLLKTAELLVGKLDLPPFVGVKHYALDDARNEAKIIPVVLRALSGQVQKGTN